MGWSLNGLDIMVINGGPMYSFTPAISLVVPCETQQEIDHYWQGLTADGGHEVQCGWLTDRFGLSWQIVPSRLGDWIGHPDPEAARAGDPSHAQHGQARHRHAPGGGRRGLSAAVTPAARPSTSSSSPSSVPSSPQSMA